jgi:hypothetical protein
MREKHIFASLSHKTIHSPTRSRTSKVRIKKRLKHPRNGSVRKKLRFKIIILQYQIRHGGRRAHAGSKEVTAAAR